MSIKSVVALGTSTFQRPDINMKNSVMYGCENCTMEKSDRMKVNSFEIWCWRRVLRMLRTGQKTNKCVVD